MLIVCSDKLRGTLLTTITFALTHCVHAQSTAAGTSEQHLLTSGATYNLGRRINSVYEDINPVLSADGTTLYYARKHTPKNKGGRRDPQDVYLSESVNGVWTPGRNAGPNLNTTSADNVCAITSDNNRLFLFVRRNATTGFFGYRERIASGWSDIKHSGLEITNRSDYLESCLAFDEQAILFTANTNENVSRNENKEERDIYVAIRKPDGSWSRAINLGAGVNTAGDEYSPFLAADGRTLFFATNGRGGFGGVDLFVARRIGDGWTEWTTPVNLGQDINSPEFDGYLSIPVNGNRALYVTRSRSIGGTDIMATTLPPEVAPSPVVLVRGRIRDDQTHSEIPASVGITRRSGERHEIIGSAYAVAAEPGEAIQLTFQARGYFTHVETIAIPETADLAFVQKDITLRSIVSGRSFCGPVFFDAGRAALRADALPTLDSIVTVLQTNPKIRIAVLGHTDNRGTIRSLRDLSRERAREVSAYFIGHGIGQKRIRYKGAGPMQPIANNDNEVNRSRNRRVEFHFVY